MIVRISILSVGLFAIVACNSSKKVTEVAKSFNTTERDSLQGLSLIKTRDCYTCHNTDKKIIGPAFQDIANKYYGNKVSVLESLAEKIRDGGKGVWGNIMMTPHSSLSKSEAETIIKYILLLKK